MRWIEWFLEQTFFNMPYNFASSLFFRANSWLQSSLSLTEIPLLVTFFFHYLFSTQKDIYLYNKLKYNSVKFLDG